MCLALIPIEEVRSYGMLILSQSVMSVHSVESVQRIVLLVLLMQKIPV
jgi:hypothetical protein